MKKQIPTEHDEQVALCDWLRAKRIHHVAIPNSQALSGQNRIAAIRNMQKLKLEGFQPGFPDILVFMQDILLCIELKRVKGGKVADNQKRWKNIINGLIYAESYICYGAEEAISLISEKL